MADLSHASPIATKLSGVETVLLHGLAFVSATVLHDDRLDRVVAELRIALSKASPRPATEKLRMAAQSVCDAYRCRNQRAGAADWCLATLKADAAVQEYHWAAFCAVAGA